MNDRCFAILVHDRPAPLDSLKSALKDLSIDTFSVRSCEEAKRLIAETQPQVVFTDTSLPDGSWMDMVNAAEVAPSPVNVIVVGANKDVKFYLNALERGAFDFVLPPFEKQALDFVVQSAAQDSRHRRFARARAAVV
jgi:DNA-binding NtrC family response regulator